MPRLALAALAVMTLLASTGGRAIAGPPYVTDDPEPTAYRHYEIYVFASYDRDASRTVNVALPSLEVNYGLMRNVQVSFTAPFAGAQSSAAPFATGFGDAQVALKVRFVNEGPGRPQVSISPAIELPTGSAARGLGAGSPKVFLPLWLQKTNGGWTYFGGGGVWRNPGAGKRDYTVTGFAVTHGVREGLNVGAEIYHQSPDTIGGGDSTGVGIGVVAERGEHHALLASFGRDVHGSATFHAYAAYELYLGPRSASSDKR